MDLSASVGQDSAENSVNNVSTVLYPCTVVALRFRTDRSGHQGLHCLLFRLHLLETLRQDEATLIIFFG